MESPGSEGTWTTQEINFDQDGSLIYSTPSSDVLGLSAHTGKWPSSLVLVNSVAVPSASTKCQL